MAALHQQNAAQLERQREDALEQARATIVRLEGEVAQLQENHRALQASSRQAQQDQLELRQAREVVRTLQEAAQKRDAELLHTKSQLQAALAERDIQHEG